MILSENIILRLTVEDLITREVSLLDNWELESWLDLFTSDAQYLVPSTDVDGDNAIPENSLFYVFDDRKRMEERVIRLNKKGAHSEWPRSKVRHLVSNIIAEQADNSIKATASFAVWRSKDSTSDVFIGHYIYEIIEADSEFKIRKKTCVLDMEALRPHGRISIIL